MRNNALILKLTLNVNNKNVDCERHNIDSNNHRQKNKNSRESLKRHLEHNYN